VIDFARDVLGEPLDPWQQWLVIHMGELLADGRPRFRQVLVIVARQNGKTHLLKVLALFWMFVEHWALIFGTSTNLDTAAESWQETVDAAQDSPALSAKLPRNAVRLTNGQQTFRNVHRSRYKIGAVNRKGGRGLRIDRLIGDELREHRSWVGYSAAYGALTARPRGQAVFITNQGDATAIVLISIRTNALAFIETGVGDERLGLFEWSAPPGTLPSDVAGWVAANPNLGRRVPHDHLRGLASRVARAGADQAELTSFLTEYLCMDVPTLNPAFDGVAWANSADRAAFDQATRGRLAACLDISPDGAHASLAVAALLEDGRVRVELVQSWTSLDELRRTIRPLLVAIKPKQLGWFPAGPAAALDADLRDRRKEGRAGWPPRGLTVTEIKTETPSVVMGFAEQILAGRVVHSGQELLDRHIEHAEKLVLADLRWVLTRRGDGHVDGAYAAAGAVHLARTMPVARNVARGVRVGPNR
jgi:hypothetical protein